MAAQRATPRAALVPIAACVLVARPNNKVLKIIFKPHRCLSPKPKPPACCKQPPRQQPLCGLHQASHTGSLHALVGAGAFDLLGTWVCDEKGSHGGSACVPGSKANRNMETGGRPAENVTAGPARGAQAPGHNVGASCNAPQSMPPPRSLGGTHRRGAQTHAGGGARLASVVARCGRSCSRSAPSWRKARAEAGGGRRQLAVRSCSQVAAGDLLLEHVHVPAAARDV